MMFKFKKIFLLLGDLVFLYFSLYLTVIIGFWGEWNQALFFSHVFIFSWLYVLWLVVFYIFDLYNLSLPYKPQYLNRIGWSLLVCFFVGVFYFYVIPVQAITPKTNLIIHLFFSGFFLWFWRACVLKFRSSQTFAIGVLDIDDYAKAIEELVIAHAHLGYTCVRLNFNDEFQKNIQASGVRMLVLPSTFHLNVEQTKRVYQCFGSGIAFIDSTQAFELFARRIPVDAVDHHWFLQNIHEQEVEVYRLAKRIFDFVTALLILIVSLPLWLVLAFLIRYEDGGNVFYTQTRLGKGRRFFSIIKFRTMRVNAEEDGAKWAQQNDSRVTKVGRVLRWTHLDELPQMLNVLKGDISLVGPRPERPEFVDQLEKVIPHYHLRLLIQPGFSGWAQINFRYARSVMDAKEKFEYDLYYIKNRSLFFDVLILLKTVRLLFRKEN